jgi:hypothetical protein
MADWPDIVVTREESPEVLLAIEVRSGDTNILVAESRIKAYMAHQSCPLGMLVTPENTVFFRNRYTGYDTDAIQQIAQCRTSELLGALPDRAVVIEQYLERRVDEWLDSLKSSRRQSWPVEAQEAMETYVLPAILSGVVRATGPRLRRTGS